MGVSHSTGVVGFVGLGNLGKVIAGRLLREGLPLTLWNRTKEKASGLAARWSDSPQALANAADVIVLNLFDSQAVREVLTGPHGVLRGAVIGKTIIDTTTNHFRDVVDFHRQVAAAGGLYLEAPVLGSVGPASQGTLTVLVSGDRNTYEGAMHLLRIIGTKIFFFGEPGLATRMKLVNNLVLGAFMASLAEAVALGERAGIRREQVLDILSVGGGNSTVLNGKKDKLAHEDFSPQFSCGAIAKDLLYLEDLVKSLGGELLMEPAASRAFQQTLSAGLGQEDFSSVFKVIRDRLSPPHG